MSFESRISADGRRLLHSPLWTGTAVTLFLIAPTLIIPGIPLWISLATLVTIGPMVVLAIYLLYGLFGRPFSSDETLTETATETAGETPIDLLKQRYADGEIDTETYERRLERILEAEERAQQVESHEPIDEITVRNR